MYPGGLNIDTIHPVNQLIDIYQALSLRPNKEFPLS
jgi:hypothetical protein